MVIPGTLSIVATPIGNLEDITLRALRILAEVDCIYAEDTRHSRKLCDRHGITTPLRSYREAAEPRLLQRTVEEVISALREGKSLACISDAGTPGVSDPGSYLVQQVLAAGFTVIPIPGVSALTALLSVSGLAISRPLFVGFLPKKKGHQTLLSRLHTSLKDRTCDAIVFYESPERIVKLLGELVAWGLPLQVCLGRELTKQFEEILRGPIEKVLVSLSTKSSVRGEITLIISL